MNQQGKLKRPQSYYIVDEEQEQCNNAPRQQLFTFQRNSSRFNGMHKETKSTLTPSFKQKLKNILTKQKSARQQQDCEIVQIFSINKPKDQTKRNENPQKNDQKTVLDSQPKENQPVQFLFEKKDFKLPNDPSLTYRPRPSQLKKLSIPPLQVKRFNRVQLIEYSQSDDQKQLVYNRKTHEDIYCEYRRQKSGQSQIKIMKQILSRNPNLNRQGIRQMFKKFDCIITYQTINLLLRKMNIVSKPFTKINKRTAGEDLKTRNFLQKLYKVPLNKILFFEQISLQRFRMVESVLVQQSKQPWIPQDKICYRDATVSLGISQKGVVSLAIVKQNISEQEQLENLQSAFTQNSFQYVILNPATTNFYEKIVQKCKKLGINQSNILQVPSEDTANIIAAITKKITQKIKRRNFIKSRHIQVAPYPELVQNITQIILEVTSTNLDILFDKFQEGLKKMMVFQYTSPTGL